MQRLLLLLQAQLTAGRQLCASQAAEAQQASLLKQALHALQLDKQRKATQSEH